MANDSNVLQLSGAPQTALLDPPNDPMSALFPPRPRREGPAVQSAESGKRDLFEQARKAFFSK